MNYGAKIEELVNLKQDIAEMVGKKILVKKILTKSKYDEKGVFVEKAYPNIFKVRLEQTDLIECYTYADVLSKNIEVSVYDYEGYCTSFFRPVNIK